MNPTLPSGAPGAADDARAIEVNAFVDGEMTGDQSRDFERRLADEPALARAVDEARALKQRMLGAFDDVLDEPVPASLLAALGGEHAGPAGSARDAANEPAAPAAGGPVSLDDARAARRKRSAWRLPEWIGLAAALLLGVQAGRLATSGAPQGAGSRPAYEVAASGELRAAAPLAIALDTTPGGTTSGDTTLGLSFRTPDGTPCRSYAEGGAVRTQGIACKRDGEWDVAWVSRTASPTMPSAAASASPGLVDGEYRTAASPVDPALLARIDAMRAGDTLDAKAEAAARAAGWARSR